MRRVGHVKWVGQFNGLLHPGDPPRPEIQPWFPVAQQSPLTGLLRDLHWDGVDHVVLTAFVERWTPKTNSFHFFFGELSITLHDVYCLFGLPMEGRVCVAPRLIDRLEIIELFIRGGADGASTSGTAGEPSGTAEEPSEAPVGELTQTQGAETEVEMLRRRLDVIGDELYQASVDRTLGPRLTTFLDRFWRRHYQS